MTATPKMGRLVLWLLPIALVAVALIAAKPWLKTTIGGPMFNWVAVAVAIFAVSYGAYFSFRSERGLDEVQKASAGFAAQWGMAAGMLAFGLLLMLPPFRDLATVLVRDWAGDPGAAPKVVKFAIAFGFCGVVFLQAIGMIVARAIWWRSKQ